MRKVTGAARWQIFLQFLSESVVTALVALAFALLLLAFLKPLVLQLSFANLLRWDLESNYFIYAIFVAFAIVVGVMAGLFPAVVLSGFQPVTVLKSLGTMKLFSNIGLRKALLVAQFTFSLVFILSVIIVFNQLQLFLRADHGFAMEKRMIIGLNNVKADAIKTELLKYPSIESVSAVSHIPAAGFSFGTGFKKSSDEKEWTDVNYFSVDEDYIRNIDVTLVAGKFFTAENGASNKNHLVLNEQAVATFQFESPAQALGQELILKDDSTKKIVIGVVMNYNHQMLMEKMDPMVLVYRPDEFRLIQVKYSGTFEEAGKVVESSWAKVNPGMKVDYKDFYTEIHRFYDVLFGDLVSILTVIAFLAIFISCLGLLGMATYTTETRIKEISIRKILGSSNGSLVYLLSKGFGSILLIAIIIGVPVSFLLNNLWLEQLAYHVSVDAPTIVVGILALVLFGTFTVVSQTWRAAYVKPVDNLKSE